MDEYNLREHLYQQVQEQSVFCDVTVEVNSWKRRYHWCVLSASPFFAKLYESKLKEQQTGVIKLAIGSSKAVDIAISFLYGRCQEMNTDDIGETLKVADFLMIEKLKTMVISRLQCEIVDKNNCLKMLILASKYEFYLENVQDYILSHLLYLLDLNEMLLLDKDSVSLIMSDPKLSYISREECFKFLVKWIGHHPSRRSDFANLFSSLDVKEISVEILGEVDLGCLSDDDKLLCRTLIRGCIHPLEEVILMLPKDFNEEIVSFLAYKLKSKSWCQLTLKNQQAEYSTRQALVQVLNNNTVVRLANPFEIQFHNLVEKHSCVKTINQTSSQDRVTIDCLAASKNELYCVRNFSVYTKFPFSATTRFEKQRSILLLPSKIRSGTACFHMELVTQLCCLHTSGSITDTAVISQPLLTVPGEVKSLCFTGGVACMLMRNTDILVMYAVYECVITFLNVEEYNIDFESFICPSQFGGLYLISESDILQIDILVSPKCISAEIVGTNRREDKTPLHSNLRNPFRPRVEISGDKIITVTRTLHEPKLQYQLLPSDIGELEDQAIIDIEWPKNVRHFGYRFDCQFVQLQLPNEATRCAIDCPHCKA